MSKDPVALTRLLPYLADATLTTESEVTNAGAAAVTATVVAVVTDPAGKVVASSTGSVSVPPGSTAVARSAVNVTGVAARIPAGRFIMFPHWLRC